LVRCMINREIGGSILDSISYSTADRNRDY
jgi:hypothetical protein